MQRDVRKFGISDKRGRVKTSSDPYIPEEGPPELSLCESCHALYHNKRWYLDAEAFESAKAGGFSLGDLLPLARRSPNAIRKAS
jgi:hypothetical protein